MSLFRLLSVPILLAGWLASLAPATAATPPIQDKAGLFHPGAIQKASQEIAAIRGRYGQSLVLDTMKAPPRLWLFWSGLRKVRTMQPADRERYFADLARKRARRNSIYVLVCKEPLDVAVAVGDSEDLQKGFTQADRDGLRERLLAGIRGGHNDQALLDAVAFVSTTLEDRLGGPPVESSSFSWGEILQVVLFLMGVWLLLEAVRAVRLGRGRESELAAQGSGGSLLPGLFASMAGLPPATAILQAAGPGIDPGIIAEPPASLEEMDRAADGPAGEEFAAPREGDLTEGMHGEP